MVTDVGLFALALAFFACLYAGVLAIAGAERRNPAWVASARNAAMVVFPLTLLAAAAVVYANLADDYSLEFAVNVSNRVQPWYLKITALWGGQNGSILFWALLMSLYIFALMWTARGNRLLAGREAAPLLPWVILVCVITNGFFLGLVLFLANPFARLWQLSSGDVVAAVFAPAGALPFIAPDGNGLNPLLRHPGMIIHPPMLYMGFTGMVIPFAFAIAALITGRTDDVWVRQTRRWTLGAWLFLGLGLAIGGRWAYDVLGWGGYWGWDAVENSSLLPWLTSAAFLHSVMIQEKRGMFKAWNMLLIILTYALVILGTFVTRTGIISSVHAFARSSIGPPFLAFVGLTLLGSAALMVWRWDRLRSENELESWLSREMAFLVTNVLFLLLAFTIAWGTYFPMLSDLLANNKLTVGGPWFNTWTGPQWALLFVLMGFGPLLAWHRASVRALGRLVWLPAVIAFAIVLAIALGGVYNPFALIGYLVCSFAGAVAVIEYVRGARSRAHTTRQPFLPALWSLVGRNRRRYGGYLVHLGVAIVGLGAISSTLFQQTTQGMIASGQSLQIGGYSIVYKSLQQIPAAPGDDKDVLRATVEVWQGGAYLGTLQPYIESYTATGERMTPPAVFPARLGTEDVYVLLASWEDVSSNAATFKVFINPLVNFLWGGLLIFALGTLIAGYPDEKEIVSWSAQWAPAAVQP
jgi:cytochrome c-type biogenesis protein CcmF